MISYSTQFPTKCEFTKERFIDTVILWNQGSRYDKLDNLSWDRQSYSFSIQEQEKSLTFEDLPDFEVMASRLVKTDEHGIWKTDFVFNYGEHLLSVRVTHETTEFTTDFAPTYYPPFFIKMIIRDGYAGDDAGLSVSKYPIELSPDNKELTKFILSHTIHNVMPVVIISRTSTGTMPIDAESLSLQLQGIAHVILVHDFNDIAESQNIIENNKPGQIYLVFPNENARTKTFNISGGDAENPELIHSRIINDVYNYCNREVRREVDTWEGIQNEKLRLAQIKMRNDNTEMYEMFGEEIEKYEEINSDLTRENQKLMAENQMLRLQLAARDQKPLLYMGEECDFYAGEIKEIILDILNDYRKNGQEQSRRADIVLDLIENNEFNEIPAKRREQVKNILKGYKTMSGSLKGQLEALGFQITDDGKHYKWTYYGDNRYMVTAAKTSSDSRAGKNLASEISNIML